MDDELILHNELEALVIKLKKMRDRNAVDLKARAYSVVITLIEQALAYYAYYIIGVPLDFKNRITTKESVE